MAHASMYGARKLPGPKKERKKRERAKVGDNNGKATHGARKHAWRKQAAWAKIVRQMLYVFQANFKISCHKLQYEIFCLTQWLEHTITRAEFEEKVGRQAGLI